MARKQMNPKGPEDIRFPVGAGDNDRTVDLELMLEEYSRIVKETLAVVKREISEPGPGRFADKATLQKIKEVGLMLESAGMMKIRLARAASTMQKVLTPEQRLEATIKYILALPGKERREIIERLAAGHLNETEQAKGKSLGAASPVTAVENIRAALALADADS